VEGAGKVTVQGGGGWESYHAGRKVTVQEEGAGKVTMQGGKLPCRVEGAGKAMGPCWNQDGIVLILEFSTLIPT